MSDQKQFVTISKEHFEWLNKECLRFADEVRHISIINLSLRNQVDALEAAIITGGAIKPDALPIQSKEKDS